MRVIAIAGFASVISGIDPSNFLGCFEYIISYGSLCMNAKLFVCLRVLILLAVIVLV